MAQPRHVALFTSDYWDNATVVDAMLQAEAPVVRAVMPDNLSVWVITRYDDARAALTDHRLSKDGHLLSSVIEEQLARAAARPPSPALLSNLLFCDGMAHARIRLVILDQFAEDRVRAWRPRIEQVTQELLTAMDDMSEAVDLIARFAFPLSLTLICDLLGIPEADRAAMRRWSSLRMQEDTDSGAVAEREMSDYLAALISARRAEPGHDLLSSLATAAVRGERLSDQEALGVALLVAGAAQETTTHLLGNVVRWPLKHPAVWQALAHDAGLLSRLVEEVLRLDSPMRLSSYRCTIAPIRVGRVLIPAGEIVLVSLTAANRDPHQFGKPDQMRCDRDASPAHGHLAFGHGLHQCVGTALVRAEAEIGLTALTQRFPDARLAVPAQELLRWPSAVMNGLRELPVLLGTA